MNETKKCPMCGMKWHRPNGAAYIMWCGSSVMLDESPIRIAHQSAACKELAKRDAHHAAQIAAVQEAFVHYANRGSEEDYRAVLDALQVEP